MAQVKAQVDKLLTNVSSAYIPKGYVSEMLLPKVPVVQSSGLLGKYGNSHLRIESTLMGGRGKAKRVEPITRLSTTYLVENHGLEGMVTADDYRNVEAPFDAEKDEVIGLQSLLWLSKEKALADVLGNTATWAGSHSTTLAGVSQFSDYANSDPIGKFKAARLAVYNDSGVAPDTAVMDWETFNTLAYHPGILDALGFAQNRAGQLSEAELAKAMGVPRLLIASAKYNSAKEGQADALASVWGKNIIFAVAPDSAGKYQTSLGYYVVFSNEPPRKVYKFDANNPPGSTGIIVTDHYDMLLSNVSAGYLIKNAIA